MMFYAKPGWPYSVASGGLVFRGEGGNREYLLLYRNNDAHGKWHLPKGVVEEGESLEQTAIQEIAEEAGVDVEVKAYLGALHSITPPEIVGYEIDKTRHYFLCEYQKETGRGIDLEHDGTEWCLADEAKKNLASSPKNEDEIIDRAEDWFTGNGT